MSELLKYMDDPDIINEPLPLREVHAIRLMLRDETKSMTPEEHADYINAQARDIIEKLGLKVKRPNELLTRSIV